MHFLKTEEKENRLLWTKFLAATEDKQSRKHKKFWEELIAFFFLVKTGTA
jgi:hypothetical protein